MKEQKLKYYLNNKNFARKMCKGKILKTDDMLQVIDGQIVLNAVAPQAEEEDGITSNTYLTKQPCGNKRWSKYDDEMFFESLECCGCEFSIMSTLFPGRTRSNLREKYKRELKNNPERVEVAMRNFAQFDMAKLQQLRDRRSNK